ncbi:DUF922 domain-containing Zn-dependent protease [Legionella sp. 29fVS95]|uniref:DUF922 domain-containing Zn-dependent protease n=1 Tax=Legionella sp. 29fVS95 TaxID=3402813 RepID=UPI003AF4B658
MKRLFFSSFLIFFFSNAAFSSYSINEVKNYYQISGNTEQTLREQMGELGPVIKGLHYDAQTIWYVTWNYNWHYNHPSQNPCYVKNVTVSVNVTSILPAWSNQNSSTPYLQNKWNTYLNNLSKHEEGHGNNGKRAAMEIEQALLNTPAMPNCNALKAELNMKAKEIISKHNTWDTQYDMDTNHGKNQGAIFP